jgi:hypothetical protein
MRLLSGVQHRPLEPQRVAAGDAVCTASGAD